MVLSPSLYWPPALNQCVEGLRWVFFCKMQKAGRYKRRKLAEVLRRLLAATLFRTS
jgi:hypothetical protein